MVGLVNSQPTLILSLGWSSAIQWHTVVDTSVSICTAGIVDTWLELVVDLHTVLHCVVQLAPHEVHCLYLMHQYSSP